MMLNKITKVTNEEVPECLGERRTFINNTLREKSVGLDLQRVYRLIHHAIEGQMTEVKEEEKEEERSFLII